MARYTVFFTICIGVLVFIRFIGFTILLDNSTLS